MHDYFMQSHKRCQNGYSVPDTPPRPRGSFELRGRHQPPSNPQAHMRPG